MLTPLHSPHFPAYRHLWPWEIRFGGASVPFSPKGQKLQLAVVSLALLCLLVRAESIGKEGGQCLHQIGCTERCGTRALRKQENVD